MMIGGVPKFLFIQTNDACNLRCEHCEYWRPVVRDRSLDLNLERKLEIIGEFAELSPGGVVVTCGGESMLDLEGYFAISRQSHAKGLRCFSVVNGTRIDSSEMAERMMAEGPDEITVSLDSYKEECHDRLRGVKGSFRRAVDALRRLLKARIVTGRKDKKVNAMLLVLDENYRDLDDAYDFALNKIGVDKLKINLLQPTFGRLVRDDGFFARHGRMDPDGFMNCLRRCDEKYHLRISPAWLLQVEDYVRSVVATPVDKLNWIGGATTQRRICNSCDRDIMVDLQGVARLCFSDYYQGVKLLRLGDLKRFWESAGPVREAMRDCRFLCGISHSVRSEPCTMRREG